MRSAFLLIPFAIDVALKIVARMNPNALGRFSFPTRFGTIGLAPSVNDVLAFSLPVPNAWIWPVGWAIVAVLLWELRRNSKLETRNSKQFPKIKFSKFELSGLFRISDFSARGGSAFGGGFRVFDRRVAIVAIVLGALSNLTDRTFLGGVTDYLSFTNLFPAFNVADLLILGGIVGWLRSTRTR